MIIGYHKANDGRITDEQHQRVMAVDAALEIAKALVSGSNASANPHPAKTALKDIAEQIDTLADAIQAAINKK
ncbi:hypothetical protein JK158_13340 [Enterobacter sp. JGM127]|nr:hypothetical protein [Enterobacter sp. JGM127]